MAAIRKTNLNGKRRWLSRDSSRQKTTFRGSRINQRTNIPPSYQSAPGFLSRSKPSRNNSGAVVDPPSFRNIEPQAIGRKNTNKNKPRHHQKAIPVMPDGTKVPVWLMRWNSLHRHTSVITFLLVSATLIVYGWTVYSQHLWSRSYKELQELQRDERQLTKHDETIKNQMAQEAQKPHSGLVSPTPSKIIFVPEATPSNYQKANQESLPMQPQHNNAVGY